MKRLLQAILASVLCFGFIGMQPVSAKPAFEKNRVHGLVKAINEKRIDRMNIPFRGNKAAELTAMMNKSGVRKAPDITQSFSDTDYFDYLEGPDGSVWYATGEFDFEYIQHEYYTDRYLKSFKYTIYDTFFNKIGEIKDKVEYKEDETRAVLYDIAPYVTQKFFNYDNNYEVIFCLSMNTQSNSNRDYSIAYSIGGQKDDDGNDVPVAMYDGLVCDAVNSATDRWSENFYLSFATEEKDDSKLDSPNWIDYLSTFKSVYRTYKKASYSGGPQLVAEKKIRLMDLPGDQMNASPLITFARDGKAYFVYSQYEKSYFVDPVGVDESVTEDNNLIVEINSIGFYDNALKEEKRISIPVDQTFDDDKVLYTFYSIGNLGFDRDIIVDGDDYKVVVAKQKYSTANDDATVDSYYIYNSDGEREKTLAEDILGFISMSDVKGFEHQYMFITVSSMGYVLSFVDVPSGEVAAIFPSMVDGYSLSSYVDRVPAALGYKYAFKAMNPKVEDGDAIEEVVWLDSDGKLIEVDKINLGKDVAMAQIYLEQSVLSPYVCNTDDEREYMFLVKRYINGASSGTVTHLYITAANTFDVLFDLTGNDDKGSFIQAAPIIESENPVMVIIYDKNGKYNTDVYSLPFTRFAGGDGSVENPYLISTPGDFREIGKKLSANYRIANDIDFSDFALSTVAGTFTGSIDGNGKTLSNITMSGLAGMFEYLSEGSSVKNLNLYNVNVDCSGHSLAGTLAASVLGSKIENVHVYALNVTADSESDPVFGGIVGRATNFTEISNSSVSGVINLPESSVGGIVGETRTSTSVVAASFVGTIIGDSEVGGIVGAASNNVDSFTDCHVDAAITAKNTVGGIAGLSARAAITRCYVEGSIKATGSDRGYYDNGPCAGGIVGTLGGDFKNSSSPEGDGTPTEKKDPVTFCMVNLTTLEGYAPTIEAAYPNQQTTIHRIVGKSNVNYEPEIVGEDEDYNQIYGDPMPDEAAINNNYAIADLALGLAGATADHNTVEGKSVDAGDLSADWFKNNLKFAYGTSVDAPWNEATDYDPALYYEVSSVINPKEVTVMENKTFDIELLLVRAVPFTEEEFFGNFSYDCDETMVEMTGECTYNNGIAVIGFKALKPGTTTLKMFGAKCEVTVLHDPSLGVDNVIDSADSVVVVANGSGITVKNTASGANVEVYNLSGVKVFNTLSDGSDINVQLASGIYIVKSGNSAVKCLVK